MNIDLLIGLNFQIIPISYHGNNVYKNIIAMNYKYKSKDSSLIAHKGISSSESDSRLSDYSFMLNLFKSLNQPKWVNKRILIVNNNLLLTKILKHWLPIWADFDFPTGKYTIAQLIKIMHYYHKHRLNLDIIPADFQKLGYFKIIKHIYNVINKFPYLRIDYADKLESNETLKLSHIMDKILRNQRKDGAITND